jgi:hypothetical protein
VDDRLVGTSQFTNGYDLGWALAGALFARGTDSSGMNAAWHETLPAMEMRLSCVATIVLVLLTALGDYGR